jgi:ankyrin repeat protein
MRSIHEAIEASDLAAVQRLLRDHPNCLHERDSVNNTPLHVAVYQENPEIVDLLLATGADVNAKGTNGDTPLHVAVTNDSAELVNQLVRAGAMLGSRNDLGRTPLTAAAHSSLEIVEILRKLGSEVDLVSAVRLGHVDAVREALDRAGADVNCLSVHPDDLIEAAVATGSEDMLRLLLQRGLSPNPSKPGKRSPLFSAVELALSERDMSILGLLLANGATRSVKNERGESLLSFVEEYMATNSASSEDKLWGLRVAELLERD